MLYQASTIIKGFIKNERTGGILLIFATLVSILISNSPAGSDWLGFWHQKFGFVYRDTGISMSLEHWVNDGLMALFFLLVGLEIERELYSGELSTFRNAMLPVVAALGGVIIPASIYFAINSGTPYQGGFGIPMATDIAFSLGVLSLLGKRVPLSLRIFLTALAIIDDLCAIIIIALFYSSDISLLYLGMSALSIVLMIILNRSRVFKLWPYLALGTLLWYFMYRSGVHATLAGVILAFCIPFGGGKKTSPSLRLEKFLHMPVPLIIMPIFALANTGIVFSEGWAEGLAGPVSAGIFLGLVAGKPIGIFLFSYIAVKLNIASLPDDLNWKHVAGTGMIAGIGFTMSIFITLLAFNESSVITISKISILISSVFSGLTASVFLILTDVLTKRKRHNT